MREANAPASWKSLFPWHIAQGLGRDCPNVAGMRVLGTWMGWEAGKG